MQSSPLSPRRRGRPPRNRQSLDETRTLLLRAGLETVTEKGFTTAGLDEILKRSGIPKGSFYHYFTSKEEFGLTLINEYESYFTSKLEQHFGNTELTPLERLRAFVADARAGMERHGYRRGCLIGNMGHEAGTLPEPFRGRLLDVLSGWQQRLAECLEEARETGQIAAGADCARLAAGFWIGWEGAVLRARLERSGEPLERFTEIYYAALAAAAPASQG